MRVCYFKNKTQEFIREKFGEWGVEPPRLLSKPPASSHSSGQQGRSSPTVMGADKQQAARTIRHFKRRKEKKNAEENQH